MGECIQGLPETHFTEDPRKIDVPVLLTHGTDDPVVPYADAGPKSAQTLRNATKMPTRDTRTGCCPSTPTSSTP